MAASLIDSTYGMDKLSYEIFSILENKFLLSSPTEQYKIRGKVRILSIDSSSDGGGDNDDYLLAAVSSLARLESSLRSNSNNPDARIVDFFDVAAGSGLGGVLAAMLFTRGPDGKPLFSAEEALHFLSKNRNHLKSNQTSSVLKRIFRRSGKAVFRKMFDGALTLRDTLKPVLIPCYDLSTGAPFLFSRADAMETDAYDFSISQICAATNCAGRRPVEMASVDGRTKIAALGGGLAMSNPTAAAITHVLNNKQEFPFAASVDDLLVLSICTGGGGSAKAADKLNIAANAGADTVDQAVATAFGENFATDSYVRIQTNLSHKNIESTLFRGRRVSEQTNADKLEEFGGKLVKEQKRRISSAIPTLCVKQAMSSSPRTSSSSTTCTTSSTSITTSTDEYSR